MCVALEGAPFIHFMQTPSVLHAAEKQTGHAQVNNGTYKSGFATSQAAYDRAQRELYAALDELEARLGRHRFLVGDRRAPALAFVHLQLLCSVPAFAMTTCTE